MNKTIVERVMMLLSHAKLPKRFWGEALMTTIDLINLSHSTSYDVPNRFWASKNVSHNYLKVFDCIAFVYLFEDQNIKDIHKGLKLVNSREHAINLDLVPLPEHYRGDVIEDVGDLENEPPIDNDPNEKVVDGNRNSVWMSKPKTKYPTMEYVLLIDKWMYKLKSEDNISRPKYKVRLVVKGFSQKKDIDFEEIFSPTVKMPSIQVAFRKFDSFMVEHGNQRTTYDHCVFVKRFIDGDFIIILLYVDDMLIVG
uniref:Retrovirus-related Pol polyprotein from transposon TNT 1-94 n=1 Tax=Cajanus cajan TaxID=3821 RepID=A0A151TRQ0_CAJCA|nr:Retrovirus-related Pol polyprotein from transposon TNT 1-94 [Cajanus cajan]